MKKYFEYIGLIAFALFSFYYTEKVTKIMNNKDPVMVSIKEYKEKTKETCKEGYYTTDGVVLGVNGKIVDIEESYSNMASKGYDESLMVFEEVSCSVNKENTLENYIIKGNEVKNSVSLFIEIKDMSLLEKIIDISKNQNIKLNLIMDGKTLEKNKSYFEKLYLDNHDILYSGTTKEDLQTYIKTIKSFKSDKRLYCISYNEIDNIEICKKEKINTIKTSYYYDKNILLNTKTNFERGNFYIYKENNLTLKELNTLINYIKGKNINIVNITELLE